MRKLKVVQMPPRVDYDTVRMLTRLQRAALRGEFHTVAVVTHSNSGEVGTGWAGGEMRPFTMLGAVRYLGNRIEREELE